MTIEEAREKAQTVISPTGIDLEERLAGWFIQDECLTEINNIMWNSYCLKEREFGWPQGGEIMKVLNKRTRLQRPTTTKSGHLMNRTKAAAGDSSRSEMITAKQNNDALRRAAEEAFEAINEVMRASFMVKDRECGVPPAKT